jgi:hypothetical protein
MCLSAGERKAGLLLIPTHVELRRDRQGALAYARLGPASRAPVYTLAIQCVAMGFLKVDQPQAYSRCLINLPHCGAIERAEPFYEPLPVDRTNLI